MHGYVRRNHAREGLADLRLIWRSAFAKIELGGFELRRNEWSPTSFLGNRHAVASSASSAPLKQTSLAPMLLCNKGGHRTPERQHTHTHTHTHKSRLCLLSLSISSSSVVGSGFLGDHWPTFGPPMHASQHAVQLLDRNPSAGCVGRASGAGRVARVGCFHLCQSLSVVLRLSRPFQSSWPCQSTAFSSLCL